MVCAHLEAAEKEQKFLKLQKKKGILWEAPNAFLEFSGEGRSFCGLCWFAQAPGQGNKGQGGYWKWD